LHPLFWIPGGFSLASEKKRKNRKKRKKRKRKSKINKSKEKIIGGRKRTTTRATRALRN
jgi:hypothetical protein